MSDHTDANGNPRNPWHDIISELDNPATPQGSAATRPPGRRDTSALYTESETRHKIQPPRPYIGDDTFRSSESSGSRMQHIGSSVMPGSLPSMPGSMPATAQSSQQSSIPGSVEGSQLSAESGPLRPASMSKSRPTSRLSKPSRPPSRPSSRLLSSYTRPEQSTRIASQNSNAEMMGFPELTAEPSTPGRRPMSYPDRSYSPERYSPSVNVSPIRSPPNPLSYSDMSASRMSSPSPSRPLLGSGYSAQATGFPTSPEFNQVPYLPPEFRNQSNAGSNSGSSYAPSKVSSVTTGSGATSKKLSSRRPSSRLSGSIFTGGSRLSSEISAQIGRPNIIPDPFGSYDNGEDDAARHGRSDRFKPESLDRVEFDPFPQAGGQAGGGGMGGTGYYNVNAPQSYYDPFKMQEYYEGTSDFKSQMRSEDATLDSQSLSEMERQQQEQQQQQEEEVDEDEPNYAARQVRMVNGNLVLDCPVADILLSKYNVDLTERDREFLYMRFQACTAEPDEFEAKNFSLRQKYFTEPRTTEMLVVVTMYNESEVLLARTLKAIFKNIRYLYSLQDSEVWGKQAWRKVVVCIVSDGRRKINPKAKALLAALGVYQEGFAKNKINDDRVVAHIYEYTTMVGISKIYDDHVTLTTENQIPVQMIFCLKEKNQRKINSHAWAFQAFAKALQPRVVTLVDAGTEPSSKSLYRLWKAFDDPQVAGACGEIKASLGRHDKLILNPLVAAQNFEYKTSNILDKPMESVFGFISVLPGAFSAYRYEALLGAPLDKYLKGQDLSKSNEDGIFNSNMYLAEDRILCFELVAKKNCDWILKYVSSASAYTDVPEHLHELITQRRRWLNGSFFSAIYSVFHFYRFWGTAHSPGRKFLLFMEYFYQLVNLLVSWFSLGSYYLVFRTLTVYLADSDAHFPPGNVLSVILMWIYLACLATTFVLSLGNKPEGTKKLYLGIVCFFAVLMAYMIFAAVFMAVHAVRDILREHQHFRFIYIFTETRFRDLVVATSSTYVLYLAGFIMYLQPWHMFNSFLQYLLLSPSYTNVFNVYAFCNMHDISWGTRAEETEEDLGVARVIKNALDGELEIVIPTTKQQIDWAYRKVMEELVTADDMQERPSINEEEKTRFYYANMRSITVLVWMVMNYVLVAVVTESGGLAQLASGGINSQSTEVLPMRRTFVFLTVILWVVAFLALYRFVGSMAYLVLKFVDFFKIRTYQKRNEMELEDYDV